MKNKSFEHFFSQIEKEIFDIEKIIDNENIRNKYNNDMFCPECFKAKLTFVEKTSFRKAHLRRIPSSEHYPKCSYNFEYATKKMIQSYFNSLDKNQIRDKLHSIMRMLCKSKIENFSTNKEKYSDIDVSPMLIKENRNVTHTKSLRRKSLNNFIDKNENGEIYAFYGKGILRTIEKEGKKEGEKEGEKFKYYFLEIWRRNNQNEMRKTSLYRGNIKDLIEENAVYNIVFIGEVIFKKDYPNIKLINKDALLFQIEE